MRATLKGIECNDRGAAWKSWRPEDPAGSG